MEFILTLFFIVALYKLSSLWNEKGDDDSHNLKHSIIALIGYAMLADGKVTKNELNAVKQFLQSIYYEQEAKAVLLDLREFLKTLNNRKIKVDIRPYCRCINQNMTYNERKKLLSLLFKISVADGVISDKEALLIQLYARYTNIHDIDLDNMKNYYTYGYQWKQNNDNRGKYHQRQNEQNQNSNQTSFNSATNSRAWALETLGLPSNATDPEIKKAYRTLAQKYHPDKQLNATDSEIQEATNKFRKINEAYEILSPK